MKATPSFLGKPTTLLLLVQLDVVTHISYLKFLQVKAVGQETILER